MQVAAKRAAWEARQAAPETRALAAARAALPIAPHCAEILEAISTRQVVLIAGETGCGKTTQVRVADKPYTLTPSVLYPDILRLKNPVANFARRMLRASMQATCYWKGNVYGVPLVVSVVAGAAVKCSMPFMSEYPRGSTTWFLLSKSSTAGL